MSKVVIHYHGLNPQRSQIVMLFVVFTITFSLIVCSLLFSYGYTLYTNFAENLEKELKSDITLENVYMSPRGTLNIRNLVVKNARPDDFITQDDNIPDSLNFSQRKIISVSSFDFRINIFTLVKYLVTPYGELSEIRQKEIQRVYQKERKNLEYMITKSISYIGLDSLSTNFNLATDMHIIEFIQNAFFVKQILPENTQILVNNFEGYVDTPQANWYANDLDVEVALSDSRGVQFSYAGALNVSGVGQDVSMNINGSSRTNDMFENAEIRTLFEGLTINDSVQLSPISTQLDKSGENLAFNVMFQETDIELLGILLDGAWEIDLKASDAEIEKMFVSYEAHPLVSSIAKDKLNGEGQLSVDEKQGIFTYSLQLHNEQEGDNEIRIDVSGDKNQVDLDEVYLKISDQFFSALGNISLFNLGMKGNIAFDISEPLALIPVKGAFDFYRTPYLSVGRSDSLVINGQAQPTIEMSYTYLDRTVEVKLGDNIVPVLQLIQDTSEKTSSMISLNINKFPLDIIGDASEFASMKVLENSHVSGTITALHEGTSITRINYSISSHNVLRDEETLFFSGAYYNKVLVVDEGKIYSTLLNDTTFSINGLSNFSKQLVNGTVISSFTIGVFSKEKAYSEYRILVRNDKEDNIYHVSINDQLTSNIYFSSNFINSFETLRRIQINSNGLHIPVIEKRLQGKGTIIFQDRRVQEVEMDFSMDDMKNGDPYLKIVGSYGAHEGNISDLRWYRNGRSLEGYGWINYDDTLDTLQMSVIETPSLDGSKLGQKTQEILGNQSYKIGYNFNYKNLTVNARNMKLGFLTGRANGLANMDFIVDFERKIVLGEILSSQLVVNTNRYELKGDFFIEDFGREAHMAFNNMEVKTRREILTFTELEVSKFSEVTGDFTYRGVQQGNVRDIFDGILFINMKDNFLSALQSKHALVPDFEANLILEPLFTDDDEIKDRYRYNITAAYADNIAHIKETQRSIEVLFERDTHRIRGLIGNGTTIANSTINGYIDEEKIDVNIILHHFDMGTANREFFQDRGFVSFDSLDMSGEISLKGTRDNPSFYGYLSLENYKGYAFLFNKEIEMKNATILISDNEFSMVNASLLVEKELLLFNAKGRVTPSSFDYMQFDIIVPPDRYFRARQMHVGTMLLNGYFKGKISTYLEKNVVNVTGDVLLNNMTVSNEGATSRQKNELDILRQKKPENYVSVSVDLDFTTEKGVTFAWPSTNFPVLRATAINDQKLFVSYDDNLSSDDSSLEIRGDLNFDSGIIYYLNKGFKIDGLNISFTDFSDPFISILEASTTERYQNESYTIYLRAESTTLSELAVDISTNPPLSHSEISSILGRSLVPDNEEGTLESPSSTGVLSTLVKLSDPLSNIGVFSQLERVLKNSLKVDYLSFKTKLVQNLLEYSIQSNTNNRVNDSIANQSFLSGEDILPYLFNESSFEIGKYVDIIYFNFEVTLDTVDGQYRDESYVPINTSFNVELPTPFFDLTWSLAPSLFDDSTAYAPVNLLSISWHKRF